MIRPLMLHHEVLLLALRDDSGKFSSGMYLYAVAGAMVSELMLLERVRCGDDNQRTLAVVSEAATGCSLLDELLAQVGASEKDRGLQHWISAAAGMKELNHRLAEQLCDLGILQPDERKVLFVFTQRVYPELDGTWEDSIRRRMADVMFHPDTTADVCTSALIALAHHADLLRPNFAADELRQHEARIKKLAAGEHLASDATKAAIQAVQAAIVVAATVPVMMMAATANS
jgi:golgi phosphoprotein 3